MTFAGQLEVRMRAFRQLHESGCFVIPNPWDVGSARLLAQLGFKALATTSSGFAWSLGRPDNHVSLSEALGYFRAVSESVDVPVSADFEGGFAVSPHEVGANVALAAQTGKVERLEGEVSTLRLQHQANQVTLKTAAARVADREETLEAAVLRVTWLA